MKNQKNTVRKNYFSSQAGEFCLKVMKFFKGTVYSKIDGIKSMNALHYLVL